MMTTRNSRPESLEEGPRCQVGSKADNPCWRSVTEKRWAEDQEPTICAEHAQMFELIDEADELREQYERVAAKAQAAELAAPQGPPEED